MQQGYYKNGYKNMMFNIKYKDNTHEVYEVKLHINIQKRESISLMSVYER